VLDDKRTELKNENEALKKKLAEYEAKTQAGEDPKELTLYNTDGAEITIDEGRSRMRRKLERLGWKQSVARHFHLHASPGSRDIRSPPLFVIN
jgi:hypothetical protein